MLAARNRPPAVQQGQKRRFYMKYLVSSARLPIWGVYEEVGISEAAARQFLRGSDMISLLWHPDPAITQAIAEALGVATTDHCPRLALEPGDEVLEVVFIVPSFISSLQELRKLLKDKKFVLANCEYRLLQLMGQ
jgi:hypothetical protein